MKLGQLLGKGAAGTLGLRVQVPQPRRFGLLLLLSGRDPARYLLIPLVSILLRVLIQIPILIGCFEIPEIRLLLLAFGATDLSFVLLTGYAVRRAGLNWKNW